MEFGDDGENSPEQARARDLFGGTVVALGLVLWEHRILRVMVRAAGGRARILYTPPPKWRRHVPAWYARRLADRAARLAAREGGRVAVWVSRSWDGLAERCAEAGVPLLRLEDGFIRSSGLGALYHPPSSLICDAGGVYYDPSSDSDLFRMLQRDDFDAALLARAAQLRERIVNRGVTKYNVGAAAPERSSFPSDRRVLLVPGQVENDASVRRGGGAVQSNLELLRAVRARRPGDYILYKPHPDVEDAGRPGWIPRPEVLRYADEMLTGVGMGPLFGAVDEVHTLTSLAGFEALLRGVPVTVYGRPFYAGWGLTEDAAEQPGRTRKRSLDELVAAALIRYPLYFDWECGRFCGPEEVLDRLAGPPGRDRRPYWVRMCAWMRARKGNPRRGPGG